MRPGSPQPFSGAPALCCCAGPGFSKYPNRRGAKGAKSLLSTLLSLLAPPHLRVRKKDAIIHLTKETD